MKSSSSSLSGKTESTTRTHDEKEAQSRQEASQQASWRQRVADDYRQTLKQKVLQSLLQEYKSSKSKIRPSGFNYPKMN